MVGEDVRIACIALSDYIGGAERRMRDLALLMHHLGHEPLLFLGNATAVDKFALECSHLGLACRRVSWYEPPADRIRSWWHRFRLLPEIIAALTSSRCVAALICSANPSRQMAAILCCRILRLPTILRMALLPEKKALPSYLGTVCRIDRKQRIVLLNNADRQRLSTALHSRWPLETICNAVITTPPTFREPPESQHLILHAYGDPCHRKGCDLLLRSMAELADDRVLLRWFGTGSERSTMIALRDELGLQEQAEFKQPVDDVMKCMQDCHLVVVPSRREGSPAVVLEALRAGRPVLGTAIPGITDVLRHDDNGLLCQSDSVNALVKRLRYAANNKTILRHMAKRASISGQAYQPSGWVSRYMKLFSIMGRGHG